MTALQAQPLPPAYHTADLELFHTFAVRVIHGATMEQLLAALVDHLQLRTLHLVAPQMPPPDIARAVVIPLDTNDSPGDLYADIAPDSDSIMTATRLAFFAPLITLVLQFTTKS